MVIGGTPLTGGRVTIAGTVAGALILQLLATTFVSHDLQSTTATASARQPSAASPRVDTIQLGPISVHDGFSLYLTAQDCGSEDPYLQVAYLTGRSPNVLSHTYTGASASCSIQRDPAGAQLRATVPGSIDVTVAITSPRPALVHPGLPVGCGAPFGPELPATARGRIDVAIHPDVFGRIAAQTANAQIFSGAPQQCPALQATAGRWLTADIGVDTLNADQPNRGAAQLEIVDPSGDNPSPGLQGVLEVQLGGRAALSLGGASGSARIGSDTRLTAGSLGFVALPACPGDSAQNGTLSGTLTIEDPLLGPLEIAGANASAAFTGQGRAAPGTCDGPGSEPVFPNLITSCDSANAGCSVRADDSVATFFDETSPGTQTITAEVLNFGDGSTPVPISNFGSVQHSYADAGSYTATLTVTDAVGTTFNATVPVVIDP